MRKVSPSRASRRSLGGWLLFAGLVVAVASVVFLNLRSPLPDPPAPDLGTLSARAQQTIEAQRENVISNRVSADAWGRYGMALATFDRPRPALDCFWTAEALDPQNPRWPYFIALLTAVENPRESMLKLRRSAELAQNTPEAPRHLLAKALLEQGKLSEADREAAALLQAHPEFAPARLIRAKAALAAGDTDQAIEHARACREDPRTRRAAWSLLTAGLRRKGNLNAAAEAADQASKAPPDKKVFDAFQAEAAEFRADPRVLTDEVHPLLAAGKLDQAESILQRLVREHSDFAETWLAQGRALFLRGRLPEAEAALIKHLQLDPASTQGCFQLGMVQLRSDKLTNAVQSFTRATELKPDFGPAWFNLGLAHGRSRNYSQSTHAFREAISCNPEHLPSYILLADILRRNNEYEEARHLLSQARAVNPSDPRIEQLIKQLPPPRVEPN